MNPQEISDCPRLTIVVPIYRSERILPELVREVQVAAEREGLAGKFELILVNDSSPDGSWGVIADLIKTYGFVRGISLRRNFGQHNATLAGLNFSRGEIVIVMDDDLQHPPSEIGNLMRAIDDGYDVCYTRYLGRQHATWKILGSKFNDWVATILLGKPPGLYLSSFKAMRREIVSELIKYDGPYPYIDGLILDTTRSIGAIDIQHHPRKEGFGNYNLRRSVSLWLKMATSFSVFPLRVATVLGVSLAFASFLLIVFVVFEKILHPETPAGWTSLIATILFVGGVQTFCIGIVGEYLGRAYLKLNRKPQFVVSKTTWRQET